VQKRIQQLRSYLDPGDPWYQPEQQHTNIRATIRLYEDGKIDGLERVYIVGREVAFNFPMKSGFLDRSAVTLNVFVVSALWIPYFWSVFGRLLLFGGAGNHGQ
jgi:hypothetical protein